MILFIIAIVGLTAWNIMLNPPSTPKTRESESKRIADISAKDLEKFTKELESFKWKA